MQDMIYRGTHDAGRGCNRGWSWWTPSLGYAETYGPRIITRPEPDMSMILDLSEMPDPVSGHWLDEECPGLAAALGMENDSELPAGELWERDDGEEIAKVLAANGWDGMLWYCEDKNEPGMLLLD